MGEIGQIEEAVRARLRSLRQTLGLSLDAVATLTHLSASTISRIETGAANDQSRCPRSVGAGAQRRPRGVARCSPGR